MKKIAAIILAAGKGKRMKSKKVNKVALHLADKPMILHTVQMLKQIKLESIVVVVGFAKESVIKLLDGGVLYAEQKKRLGTAHAVSCGFKKIPQNMENILVLNGDDSAFYTVDVIKKLIDHHLKNNAAFTFLTLEKDNPFGLGRVLRDSNGKVKSIIEEKDATIKQKKIKEINPACYVFRVEFLKKYLKEVEKSSVTGEYYLTSLIGIGMRNNEKIETLKNGIMAWRGVNTKDELEEAEKIFKKKNT